MAETDLLPMIEKRNTAMNACQRRRTRYNTKTLKNARKTLKNRVKKAKNDWIKGKQSELSFENNSNNTKKCWDALKDLKKGFSKTRPNQITKMKKEDGSLCKTAEENAQVFYKHFKNLYGISPNYDETVIDSIPQHTIKAGIENEPTILEIQSAIRNLKENAPGESGIPAKVWKTLMYSNRTFDILRNIVIDFWTTELTPKQWEKGLLKILPKKGDLRLPGNYRGIMLLETSYKIVAIILNNRLKTFEEDLENHENQCGFRTGRGCIDAIFTVKMAIKKRSEHGLESWVMFLDLIKAFDRVPRELLWKVLRKIGVPEKLVKILESLHSHFEINFSIDDVTQNLENVIGVKQGDILGPRLFNLFMYAVMLTWNQIYNRSLCIFKTKPDFVLTGRSYRARGIDFSLPDSQYADDTAILFISRELLEEFAPLLIAHFAKFGLSIHVGSPEKESKTKILFVAAPNSTYADPKIFDNQNLSDVELGNRTFFPIVDNFEYLGSVLTRKCSDETEITKRITKASNAFGSIRKPIFNNKAITMNSKKRVYEGLILPILLYGAETWSLTEALYQKLRAFHHRCIRSMTNVNRRQMWEERISTNDLLNQMNLKKIDVYIVKRQLQWAGHVCRMEFERTPRKMMSCWVRNKRPIGCPLFTYGRSLKKALKLANIDDNDWHEMAIDRGMWRNFIDRIS